ncbi:TraB/GumN family protein [Treponema phagedenis]|uniref:TraB/GumN family protein n=1 Tax=Treponema phagedenis TaxID=162 RepID=UPI0011ECB34F|nr:TraB/GumN family protein [Treponema phagedenis]TYT76888.1 TraB/GumN family protein [Treponema phagedenis]
MKALRFTVFLFCILCFASCASVKSDKIPELIVRQERMLWEIRSENSSVFIVGTIHVGSEEIYPLDETILDLFDSATRIYAELSTEDINNLSLSLQKMMLQGMLENMGKPKLLSNLSIQETVLLNKILGAANVQALNGFEPWVMKAAVEQQLFSDAKIDPAKGLDLFFYKRAGTRKVLGLDDLQTQLDLLSFGTYDDQLYLLKETIKECQDLEDFQANLKKIMQAYVHDDRKELGTLVQSIELLFPEDAPNDLYTRYLEALLYTRNQDWAKKNH